MLPRTKKFFLLSFFLFLFLIIFTKQVSADVTCSVHPSDRRTDLYGNEEYVDIQASWFLGETGDFTVEMRFAGSDPALSPGKQDWTNNIVCIDQGFQSFRCSAGAYYTTNGCYIVEARVIDEIGTHYCGYTYVDVCTKETIQTGDPLKNFTLTSGNPSKSKSYGDYICGAKYVNQTWTGNSFNNCIWGVCDPPLPPAYIDVLPAGDIYLSEWVNSGCVSYGDGCISPPSSLNYPILNVRDFGAMGNTISWTLRGIEQDPTLTANVQVSNIYHRTQASACPLGGGSCSPIPSCYQIEYQKADGSWSSDNFTVLPSTSVNLRCSSYSADPDSWNWSSLLPSTKVSSFYGGGDDNHYLGQQYTISSSNLERWEPFSLSPPLKSTSWIIDKLLSQVSWSDNGHGSFQIYGNIADNSGTPLLNDSLLLNRIELLTTKTNQWLSFDFGGKDLNEPVIQSNTTYNAILRAEHDPPTVQIAWWNNYFAGGKMNNYEIWARPNIQGTFSPVDKNSSQITWVVPTISQATQGEVYTISSHPHNTSCGWASGGDTITATIGNFSNISLEYYLEDFSAGNKIDCANPTYLGLGATIGGTTLPCGSSMGIAPSVYQVTPVLSTFTFVSYRLEGGVLQTGTIYPFDITTLGGNLSYILKIAITPAAVTRWWQSKDGDVQSETGSIVSAIPATASPKVLSIDGEGKTPGVFSYATFINTGAGTLSAKTSTDWKVNSNYEGPSMGFDYLINRLKILTANNTFTGTMPTESGIYYSSTPKDLTGSFPSGKKIVIFVKGDVTVNNNIVVPEGSFFALISSRDITFVGTVTSAQGFFLADGTLSDGAGNVAFDGQGSFVGRTGVSLLRNLGGGNSTTPAEMFTLRPDFYMNAPKEFMFSISIFQEIAP